MPAAPPPTLVELDYVAPTPDREARVCGNCVFWGRDRRCAVHAPSLPVDIMAVCSQYIFGEPSRTRRSLPLAPLDPHFTGLVRTRMGSACTTCSWYGEGSRCRRAAGTPKVAALGCCDAWHEAGFAS
jgi:hypothetical protein